MDTEERGGWDEPGDEVSHKYTSRCETDSQWEAAV